MSLLLILAAISVFLTACAGSKNIQGTWKVSMGTEEKATMEISKKEIVITNEAGDKINYKYTHNKIGTSNGINYYGLTIEGTSYSIVFPDKKDKSIAVFIKTKNDDALSGTLLYTMNRTKDPIYQEYAEKYLH